MAYSVLLYRILSPGFLQATHIGQKLSFLKSNMLPPTQYITNVMFISKIETPYIPMLIKTIYLQYVMYFAKVLWTLYLFLKYTKVMFI